MVDPAIRPAWRGAKVCGPAPHGRLPGGRQPDAARGRRAGPARVVVVATVGGYLLAGAWGEILTEAARHAAGSHHRRRGSRYRRDRGASVPGVQPRARYRGLHEGKSGCAAGTGAVRWPHRPARRSGVRQLGRHRHHRGGPDRRRLRGGDHAPEKESEIIGKLREGRTTIELLGLSDPRKPQHPCSDYLVPLICPHSATTTVIS